MIKLILSVAFAFGLAASASAQVTGGDEIFEHARDAGAAHALFA